MGPKHWQNFSRHPLELSQQKTMKSNRSKSLTAVFLVILLMFSLWLSVVAQSRVLPSPSSSQNALLSSNSERVKPAGSKQPAIAASLKRIPPSIPNPTQNK